MAITNSTTAVKNCLWQSERFLIWTDGLSLPVFYDGNILRRSNGGSLVPIATTAAAFTIPPVGQSVSVPISNSIATTYWGQSFLVNTSQFILQNTTIASTQPFLTAASLVLQSTTGDTLASASISDVALVSRSTKYAGWITTGGVIQGSNTISNWQSILAPVGATGGTPATQFTVNFPASTAFDPNYNQQSTYFAVSVGDVISVNGKSCTVNSLSYVGANNTYITSAICTPNSTSATGVAITGTIVPVQHTWCIQTNQFGQCTLTASSKAGSFSGTGSGNMNGGTSGSGSVANYFSVALASAPQGLTNGVQYGFQSQATNGTLVNFIGTISGSNLINCQMASPPVSTAPVNSVTAGAQPTALTQILLMTSTAAVVTTVGTVYNGTVSGGVFTYSDYTVPATSASASLPIIVSGTQQIVSGQVLIATSRQGHLDIFLVNSTSQAGGTGSFYATLVNQTGTVANVMAAAASIIPIPELPICVLGVYGLGRNWISLPDGKSYVGGDLVGASSGTNAAPTNYNYEDAVLKVSQNQFLAGGTTFKVPGAGAAIRAMKFTAQLDASLGQGPLQIFTDENVFSNLAPVDATEWATLTNPIEVEGLIGSGGIAQTAVAQSNSDLLFRLSDGGVQSMLLARLDFNKWGNTPISKEVNRCIENDPPELLPFTSMETFNKRMLMTCQFAQADRGVYGPALVSLNFDPISSLSGKAPTIWEGQWTGLNVLQVISGFFNGVKECYAICLSDDLTNLEIHQIMQDGSLSADNGSTPITWSFESPMLLLDDPNSPRKYKRLVNGEFSFRNIVADVKYQVFYRADQDSDWTLWYVSTIVYRGASDPGYRRRIPIGQPNPDSFDPTNNQPTREGYNFQIKIVFTGPGEFITMRVEADVIPQPQFGQPT